MAWRWVILHCPHCLGEFRRKVSCVEAEIRIDELEKELAELKKAALRVAEAAVVAVRK